MLIDIKKKSIAELGHSDRLKVYINPSKIYVNPGIEFHSKSIQMSYSLKPLHTTSSMNLTVHFICSMIRLVGVVGCCDGAGWGVLQYGLQQDKGLLRLQ